jgi:hypothetical protein
VLQVSLEDSRTGHWRCRPPPAVSRGAKLSHQARDRDHRPFRPVARFHGAAYRARGGTRGTRGSLLQIVSYSPAHHEAVERLNARLAEAGSEWSFPARERPAGASELPAWDESFVAVDDGEAYGGYILKHRRFFLEGDPVDLGALQMPLSLGQVDSAYGHVSVALLIDAVRRSPYLYSLGLGSEETQYARLLTAAGWQHITVPFFFDVKSANRFAREIRLPAGKAKLQRALRVLGRARLARTALDLRRLVVARSRRRRTFAESVTSQELADFDRSADDVFSAGVGAYALVADRGQQALRRIFPTTETGFIRLAIRRGEEVVGWAVVLDAQMRDNKYFGNMRVGSIADCFAAPRDAESVVAAADAYLTRRGVDIVVSNQLHPVWCDALKAAGYEQGPSNFFFYFSQELADRLAAISRWQDSIHVNRGDGEGPGHLMGDEDFST